MLPHLWHLTNSPKKYCKDAEIENLHFHDPRHEAVTRLAQILSILNLAKMIGHRDLQSLQVYNPTAEEIAWQLD